MFYMSRWTAFTLGLFAGIWLHHYNLFVAETYEWRLRVEQQMDRIIRSMLRR